MIPQGKSSLLDNLSFYNEFYLNENLEYFVSSVLYYYDDVIVNVSKKITEIENVKYINYNSSTMPITGEPPVMPHEGQPIQMAVSTGFLRKAFGFNESVTPDQMLEDLNYEFRETNAKGEEILINVQSVFALFGVSRTPVSSSFVVTGIVEDDEPIIYMREIDSNLVNYAKASYLDGSYLTISNYKSITIVLFIENY